MFFLWVCHEGVFIFQYFVALRSGNLLCASLKILPFLQKKSHSLEVSFTFYICMKDVRRVFTHIQCICFRSMHMFSYKENGRPHCGHTHRYLSYLTVAIKKFSLCNAIIFDIEDESTSDFKDASCILVHSTRKL